MARSPERWLVAAWPGPGQVPTTAAVYLLSKLRMQQVGEFRARDLFELESVEVQSGLLHPARLPRSRLFLWSNRSGGPEIIVFLGEAQPQTGKLALCQRIMTECRALGVTHVFTFSALATNMHPESRSRTFAIASDVDALGELTRLGIDILPAGSIDGLNGVALAAAAEAGIPAVGLLGEIPALAEQLSYPTAAACVLRAFSQLAGLALDLGELEEYGRGMQAELSQLYDEVQKVLRDGERGEGVDEGTPASGVGRREPRAAPPPETNLSDEEAARIERLFREARRDRSKGFLLKKELDRLGVFSRYEDRFLNLFEPNG